MHWVMHIWIQGSFLHLVLAREVGLTPAPLLVLFAEEKGTCAVLRLAFPSQQAHGGQRLASAHPLPTYGWGIHSDHPQLWVQCQN